MPTTITLVLTEEEYSVLLKAKLFMAAKMEREVTWKEAAIEAFTEWAKAWRKEKEAWVDSEIQSS